MKNIKIEKSGSIRRITVDGIDIGFVKSASKTEAYCQKHWAGKINVGGLNHEICELTIGKVNKRVKNLVNSV